MQYHVLFSIYGQQ